MYKIIPVLILAFLLIQCGTEDIVQPEYLNAPSDLTAYPENGKIKIKFYSNNKEDTFDGFNIYISKSSLVKSQPLLLPIANPDTGGIPTVVSTSKDIAPSVPISVEINRDANDNPIENGVTYYIIVRAHSTRNFKSEPSNEASTTPRIDNMSGILLYDNDGFRFSSLSKSTPYDFVVTIQNSTTNKAFITGKNGCMIQNKGYYQDWGEVNQADTTGYIEENIPVEIKEGYVIIFKTADSHYAKIFVHQISFTGVPYIKIWWAYQPVINNKDI